MEIMAGPIVMGALCGLVALAFQPLDVPHRLRDVNVDGETD